MYNLSIVLPVFNEEIRLRKTLPALEKFLKDSKKYNISLIKYKKNIGKGYAVRKGVLKAKNQWILLCDADLSVHPNQFNKWFFSKMINSNKCAYYGSREHIDSKVKASLTRLIIGFFFRRLIKFLFKINYEK